MKWLYNLVDKWHGGGKQKKRPSSWDKRASHVPLHEFLGMTENLYARWLERPPKYVLGLDEVGYGALAGPLVIGAALAPASWEHPLLKDSKKFSNTPTDKGAAERKRAATLSELSNCRDVTFFVHRTSNEEVDRAGVFEARMKAFLEVCLVVLQQQPDTLIVIDGDDRVDGLDHVCLPKADGFVPQVMAASIIAKVSRDTEMRQLDGLYPQWGFGHHKGYGTDEHRDAILKYGLCPIHRRSYKMRFLREAGVTTSSP